jgi:hypothetical protein
MDCDSQAGGEHARDRQRRQQAEEEADGPQPQQQVRPVRRAVAAHGSGLFPRRARHHRLAFFLSPGSSNWRRLV